ncbi:hypothetical protein D3C81_1702480 [compost metagenome]
MHFTRHGQAMRAKEIGTRFGAGALCGLRTEYRLHGRIEHFSLRQHAVVMRDVVGIGADDAEAVIAVTECQRHHGFHHAILF